MATSFINNLFEMIAGLSSYERTEGRMDDSAVDTGWEIVRGSFYCMIDRVEFK